MKIQINYLESSQKIIYHDYPTLRLATNCVAFGKNRTNINLWLILAYTVCIPCRWVRLPHKKGYV